MQKREAEQRKSAVDKISRQVKSLLHAYVVYVYVCMYVCTLINKNQFYVNFLMKAREELFAYNTSFATLFAQNFTYAQPTYRVMYLKEEQAFAYKHCEWNVSCVCVCQLFENTGIKDKHYEKNCFTIYSSFSHAKPATNRNFFYTLKCISLNSQQINSMHMRTLTAE